MPWPGDLLLDLQQAPCWWLYLYVGLGGIRVAYLTANTLGFKTSWNPA